METEFVVKKRICTAADGFQFLTSGFPNRHRNDHKVFKSMDGLWSRDLLPGLKSNEYDMLDQNGNPDTSQGIEVNVHISRELKEGYRHMWVFGFCGRSRLITEFKPLNVRRGKNSTIAEVKQGDVYIEHWCNRDHFPDIPEGAIFPVYVKVKRIEPESICK